MFNWIYVNVVNMSGKIGIIANCMLPVAVLPQAALMFLRAPRRRSCRRFRQVEALLRNKFFDEAPARWVVRVVLWQCPDAMQVVGQKDECIDTEICRQAHAFDRTA